MDQPWSIVDKKAFIRLLKYIAHVHIKIPDLKAIKEASINVLDELKVKLQQRFLNISTISFTVDIAPLGATMHWVEDDWAVHKRVLIISELVGKHSMESMLDIVLK